MESERKALQAGVTLEPRAQATTALAIRDLALAMALEQTAQKVVVPFPLEPPCVVSSLSLGPAFATQTAQPKATAALTMPSSAVC